MASPNSPEMRANIGQACPKSYALARSFRSPPLTSILWASLVFTYSDLMRRVALYILCGKEFLRVLSKPRLLARHCIERGSKYDPKRCYEVPKLSEVTLFVGPFLFGFTV